MDAAPAPKPDQSRPQGTPSTAGDANLTLPSASSPNVFTTLQHPPVITIDGGAGSGKSSVALLVAEKLGGAEVIDSGRWFRALALICSLARVQPNNNEDVEFLAKIITFINAPRGSHSEIVACEQSGGKVFTFPISSTELDSQEIAENASIIALNASVREIFRERQETLSQQGCITVGRAQGAEVFSQQFSERTNQPVIRFLLHADLGTRAERRFLQSSSYVRAPQQLDQIKAALQDRDSRDMTRKVAPLITPEEASNKGYIVIETTNLSLEQVAERITSSIHDRFPGLKPHTTE